MNAALIIGTTIGGGLLGGIVGAAYGERTGGGGDMDFGLPLLIGGGTGVIIGGLAGAVLGAVLWA